MQHSGVIVLVNNIDKIVDNLFVGGNPTDDDVKKFSSIVAMNHAPHYRVLDLMHVLVYPIKDDDVLPNLKHLRDLVKCVESFMEDGPTLVHCTAGLNRSAMVAGMVLINRGMSARQAIDLIREKRGRDALYNKTFVDWLYRYADERFVTEE